MATSNVLYKPGFWLLFIALIIIALYFYGRNILDDRSDLKQTKTELQKTSQELSLCTIENDKKFKKIDELNRTILEKNNAISERDKTIFEQTDIIAEKDSTIQELYAKITEFKNRHPQVETKYVDRIIYKDKPEPYHPFGKGNGKLTLFKTCNCYNLKFWIDGEYVGQTGTIFKTKPLCGEIGTISKIILVGKHHIKGKDDENHSWDFYITIDEDQCLIKGVK